MNREKRTELTSKFIELIISDIQALKYKLEDYEKKVTEDAIIEKETTSGRSCEECKKENINGWRLCRVSDLLENVLADIKTYISALEKSEFAKTPERSICRKTK